MKAISISSSQGQIQALDSYGTIQNTYQIDIPNIEKIKFEINQDNIILLYKTFEAQDWTLRICDKYLIIIFIKVNFIPGNSDIQLAIVANNLFIQWTQNDNLMSSQYEFLDLQGNQLSTGVIQSDIQISSIQSIVLMNTYVGFTWTKLNEDGQWDISYAVMNQNGQFVNTMEIQCSENCLQCINFKQCIHNFLIFYNINSKIYLQTYYYYFSAIQCVKLILLFKKLVITTIIVKNNVILIVLLVIRWEIVNFVKIITLSKMVNAFQMKYKRKQLELIRKHKKYYQIKRGQNLVMAQQLWFGQVILKMVMIGEYLLNQLIILGLKLETIYKLTLILKGLSVFQKSQYYKMIQLLSYFLMEILIQMKQQQKLKNLISKCKELEMNLMLVLLNQY